VIVSGSQNLPVGAILFEEDGSIQLSLMNSLDEEDTAAITLISDYFQYALSREDWMLSFVDQFLPEDPINNSVTKLKSIRGSHLRVIEGGKSDTSGSQ